MEKWKIIGRVKHKGDTYIIFINKKYTKFFMKISESGKLDYPTLTEYNELAAQYSFDSCLRINHGYKKHTFSIEPKIYVGKKLTSLALAASMIFGISGCSSTKDALTEFAENGVCLEQMEDDSSMYKMTGVDITKIPENSVHNLKDIIEFVYTGNLICGRWKTLAKLGDVIRKLNKEKIVARLSIYSASLLTNKMKKSFNFDELVVWKGRIPASEVYAVQNEADVLVHAESLNYIEALEVRLSFSTKIIDYLAMNKCIMALGCAGIASIEYFKKYDNAIVATNAEEIENRIRDILKDKNILKVYAEKSRRSAIKLHDDRTIKENFAEDIKNLS